MRIAVCPLEGQNGHEAGRKLLAKLYGEKTGKGLPPISLTARGKPYFPDSPLHFSITHTKRHAFCVLSEKNVGIDAEEMDREISLGLAEKILSPGEYAQWEQAQDKRLALLAFWVLKEAEAKRTGEGLRGYPSHTDFSLQDLRVQEIEGCLVAILED